MGLRVLVVDDDPTWLKILEKMLRKCSYEGTYLDLVLLRLSLHLPIFSFVHGLIGFSETVVLNINQVLL